MKTRTKKTDNTAALLARIEALEQALAAAKAHAGREWAWLPMSSDERYACQDWAENRLGQCAGEGDLIHGSMDGEYSATFRMEETTDLPIPAAAILIQYELDYHAGSWVSDMWIGKRLK